MRLSTRARYGMRFMVELALNYNQGSIFLREIAQNEKISEKYLSYLIIPLKAEGLIYSSRGVHGGYRLAKAPDLITVKDVVQVLEGDIRIVECVKDPSVCNRTKDCITREIWKTLDDKILTVLNSITLKDLIKPSKDSNQCK